MAVLAIHGGAGGDGPWRGLSQSDPQRLACMEEILFDIGPRLASGELCALDAVTQAVKMLEDEPLFNAGRGSVLGANGQISMDASLMDGHTQRVGSVVHATEVRHPIAIARSLLENEWPVMLQGGAIEAFAAEQSHEIVNQDWLQTELRQAQWQKWKTTQARPGSTDEDEGAMLDHDGDENGFEMGTVGAVALDSQGHLAAATSTGGMTGKPTGRVGDTPIIGAGTWADLKVAVSCTGVGEAFIRTCAAREVSVKVNHEHLNIQQAADIVLGLVEPFGGRGGIIAVDTDGNVALPFQTRLMYRGHWSERGIQVGIGPTMFESAEEACAKESDATLCS